MTLFELNRKFKEYNLEFTILGNSLVCLLPCSDILRQSNFSTITPQLFHELCGFLFSNNMKTSSSLNLMIQCWPHKNMNKQEQEEMKTVDSAEIKKMFEGTETSIVYFEEQYKTNPTTADMQDIHGFMQLTDEQVGELHRLPNQSRGLQRILKIQRNPQLFHPKSKVMFVVKDYDDGLVAFFNNLEKAREWTTQLNLAMETQEDRDINDEDLEHCEFYDSTPSESEQILYSYSSGYSIHCKYIWKYSIEDECKKKKEKKLQGGTILGSCNKEYMELLAKYGEITLRVKDGIYTMHTPISEEDEKKEKALAEIKRLMAQTGLKVEDLK